MDAPGPVALVGSGEFLPGMADVDAELLEGRPRRAVVLPTAAAREGDGRVAYWLDLAHQHFEALGVETVGLDVRTRTDASDPDTAARVAGAGLVYLSGGDPHHLAATLHATVLWRAIEEVWERGAAVGGCSAGAMALTSGAPPDLFAAGGTRVTPTAVSSGLGLVPGVAVMPHFDRIHRWRPDAVEHFRAWLPEGATLVGIDEDTALLHAGHRWWVRGAASVRVFDATAPTSGPVSFRAGDDVPLGS
ncbi:MAG TPA: Type 1 glutamine amidotransferase-like domain-containing protein [Acidimicrobiales bacterium]|nr:Type 1 glutamine amidotransferase-like domain-containing protein [Acidimicrobiales bacterium]